MCIYTSVDSTASYAGEFCVAEQGLATAVLEAGLSVRALFCTSQKKLTSPAGSPAKASWAWLARKGFSGPASPAGSAPSLFWICYDLLGSCARPSPAGVARKGFSRGHACPAGVGRKGFLGWVSLGRPPGHVRGLLPRWARYQGPARTSLTGRFVFFSAGVALLWPSLGSRDRLLRRDLPLLGSRARASGPPHFSGPS